MNIDIILICMRCSFDARIVTLLRLIIEVNK